MKKFNNSADTFCHVPATSDCPRLRFRKLTDIVRITNYLYCNILAKDEQPDNPEFISNCFLDIAMNKLRHFFDQFLY